MATTVTAVISFVDGSSPLAFRDDGAKPHWGGENADQRAFVIDQDEFDTTLSVGLFLFWANHYAHTDTPGIEQYKLDSSMLSPLTLSVRDIRPDLLAEAERSLFKLKPLIRVDRMSTANQDRLNVHFTTLVNQVTDL